MKIAFAIERFSPLHGGAERYAWGLAHWLDRQGHQVDIYTTEAAEPESEAINPIILDTSAGEGRPQARFAEALQNALRGKAYDVVHGFNHVWPCDLLRLGGGVHLAFEQFNIMSAGGPVHRRIKEWVCRYGGKYKALRENEHMQFADPDRHFMAVSQKVADDMATYYPECRDRIHVIRNGLNPDLFDLGEALRAREHIRSDLGVPDRARLLLFVSNNYRLKGLQDILPVLRSVADSSGQDVRMVVLGRDHAAPFVRIARNLGVDDRVIFKGPVERMLDYYGAADALVHPTYYDACANVCLEAAACGLPVLTSTNNGSSEMLAASSGTVTIEMPCAAEQMWKALTRVVALIDNESARAGQIQAVREVPIEDNYQQVMSVYGTIAAEKGLS